MGFSPLSLDYLRSLLFLSRRPAGHQEGYTHALTSRHGHCRVRWFCNGENPRAAALLDSLLRASTIVRKRSEPQGVSNHPSLLHTILRITLLSCAPCLCSVASVPARWPTQFACCPQPGTGRDMSHVNVPNFRKMRCCDLTVYAVYSAQAQGPLIYSV